MAQGSVRNRIWTPPPLVSSLPSSPYDGQEVYYVASDGNSVIWHLRYRAGSSSSFKWEFVGGNELFHQVDGSVNTASGTYVDLTGGPTLTAPMAGDYQLSYGVHQSGTVATAQQFYTPKIGANATNDADGILGMPPVANYVTGINGARTKQFTAAAGAECKMQYRTNAGTATFMYRFLSLRPIRVS